MTAFARAKKNHFSLLITFSLFLSRLHQVRHGWREREKISPRGEAAPAAAGKSASSGISATKKVSKHFNQFRLKSYLTPKSGNGGNRKNRVFTLPRSRGRKRREGKEGRKRRGENLWQAATLSCLQSWGKRIRRRKSKVEPSLSSPQNRGNREKC